MEAGWNFGLLPWTLPARSCLPARARCPDFPQSASTPSPFDIKHRQRQPRLQYTHKPTIPARLLHLADGSYGERLNPEGIPMSIDAGTGNPLSQGLGTLLFVSSRSADGHPYTRRHLPTLEKAVLYLPSGTRWRRNPLITISPYQPSLSAFKHSFPRHVTSKYSDHDPL